MTETERALVEALRRTIDDIAELRRALAANQHATMFEYPRQMAGLRDLLREVTDITGIPVSLIERVADVLDEPDSVTPGEASGDATTPDPAGLARPVPGPDVGG